MGSSLLWQQRAALARRVAPTLGGKDMDAIQRYAEECDYRANCLSALTSNEGLGCCRSCALAHEPCHAGAV